MKIYTTLYNLAARMFYRAFNANARNQEKLKKQTHLRQKPREFPKAPNRQANRMAIWRQYRGI